MRNANTWPLMSVDALQQEAERVLERAGFSLHHASQKSESTYWRRPGVPGCIRVSQHYHNRPSTKQFRHERGLPVLAAIVFASGRLEPKGMKRITRGQLTAMISLAIGDFVLKHTSALDAIDLVFTAEDVT